MDIYAATKFGPLLGNMPVETGLGLGVKVSKSLFETHPAVMHRQINNGRTASIFIR